MYGVSRPLQFCYYMKPYIISQLVPLGGDVKRETRNENGLRNNSYLAEGGF